MHKNFIRGRPELLKYIQRRTEASERSNSKVSKEQFAAAKQEHAEFITKLECQKEEHAQFHARIAKLEETVQVSRKNG